MYIVNLVKLPKLLKMGKILVLLLTLYGNIFNDSHMPNVTVFCRIYRLPSSVVLKLLSYKSSL